MPDFSKRSVQAEMMDDFTLGAGTIYPIMDELEVVNKLLGGYSVFLDAFKKLEIRDGLSISDWGCGGGDSLRMIADWAHKQGLKINLTGVDATPSAIEYARQKALNYSEISFLVANVMDDCLQPEQFDIIISSLFTHHFEDQSWIRLIQKMYDCARKAVVINDLHRHWFAYYSIGLITGLFSKSEMVKHDSKVSVLRGFTRKELINLLEKAGIKHYTINWKWAFRYQVILFKQ